MKIFRLLAGLLLLVFPTMAQEVSQQVHISDANHAQDEAAIRKKIAIGDDAWNRRDVKAFLANTRFTENYDHINVAGKWGSGKDQVEKGMTEFFQTQNPASIYRTLEKIRFITPDVAVLVIRNTYSEDQRTWDAMAIAVAHKMNGEWWNECFQNTLVKSREEAVAQAARASSPMAQTEPEIITPPASKIDFSNDVAVIRKHSADDVDAWNRHDPKTMMVGAHITEQYDHINIAGKWGSGRSTVEKGMADYLATNRSTMATSIAKIRFITPDVAIVIARREYTRSKTGGVEANDQETLKAISTAVLHKVNGEWCAEAFQNTYVRPSVEPTATEQKESGAHP